MPLKKTAALFLAFCLVAVIAVTAFSSDRSQPQAFCFGMGLFTINLALLGFLASRLLSGSANKTKPFSNPLFLGLMPLKFGLIGLGTYFALVTLAYSPWFFVGGATAGLGFAALSFSINSPNHFKVLPDA